MRAIGAPKVFEAPTAEPTTAASAAASTATPKAPKVPKAKMAVKPKAFDDKANKFVEKLDAQICKVFAAAKADKNEWDFVASQVGGIVMSRCNAAVTWAEATKAKLANMMAEGFVWPDSFAAKTFWTELEDEFRKEVKKVDAFSDHRSGILEAQDEEQTALAERRTEKRSDGSSPSAVEAEIFDDSSMASTIGRAAPRTPQ